MAGTFLKWLIPGAVTVLAGTAIAATMTSSPIASDLEARSVVALQSGNIGWASVRIEGRDAILAGTATTQAMIDDAVTRVAAVPGIRDVATDVVLAEFVSPFPFSASLADNRVTLAGGYPSEAVHQAILAGAGDVADTTRLMSGGPDPLVFEGGARFAVATLALLDQGEIALADRALSISGRAKSPQTYAQLQGISSELPANIELAGLTVTPPLASPYIWSASFDGTRLTLSGNIPDATLEAEMKALVPTDVAVSTSLTLASGEPSGFAANALNLLKSLILLENGEARISDSAITLSGAPASAAIVEKVTGAVTGLGGAVTLEPPRIDQFSLTIAKSSDGLVFTGFVPDAPTRERLAALQGADASALALGRGAPDKFASGLDFGLDLLTRFGEGRFELNGTSLAVSGRSASLADFRALLAQVEEGAPQGFSLGRIDIRPPVADPYLFRATREKGGATTLTGYLPDDAARAELTTHIADLAADDTSPADGAPENFVFRAGKGLDVLALLDSGSLIYDGTAWAIEGLVDTPQKGFAADAAFSEAGLRTMGFRYDVRQPSLPIISPYTWRAQKTGDGAISLAGFAPHDTFRASVAELVPDAVDATALGAGAPADFETSAAAGLEGLLALEEGALGLNGTLWTLTGEVADAATRDAIQTALSAKVDTANWRIAIQARDSAPLVTPYLWSATRLADGTIDLTGYAPSDTLKTAIAAEAGSVGRDSTSIASGEPAGFAEDVSAGLAALAHLADGKAAFDGSRWILTGTAASQQDGEAALAALLAGSRGGAGWTSAIAGYVSPASSSEASSEPVSSEPASEPSSEQSSEPLSSEPLPSSESAEMSSSEPASSELSAAEASSEPQPVEEAADDRSLIVVDPLPQRFVFEASKEGGQPIALKGEVVRDVTIAYFGQLAGDVPTDSIIVGTNLPDDFVASGATGLRALLLANEGRLGFDGRRWWLRGMVETPATRDTITASLAALPGGDGWSVFIGILSPMEICRDRVAALERRNAITFQSGSATLTETSLPVLDELATDLNLCPEASVHVEGHTDADGAEDLNLALSVSRAEAVVEALIARNVDLERLYAEGYGESQPIADNDTREGKARNRRIAFSIAEE
jgi:flagellar motor protein MotB